VAWQIVTSVYKNQTQAKYSSIKQQYDIAHYTTTHH